MDIYIGNINYKVGEDEIKKIFESLGTVENVTLIKDKLTGRSKGFGFVQMPDTEEAEKAIEQLNGQSVGNRNLVVKQAHSKRRDPANVD